MRTSHGESSWPRRVWLSRCSSWSEDRRANGAAGGIRTHTPFRTGPFEGPASTVPPPPHATDQFRSGGLRGRVGVQIGARRWVAALELHVPALLETAHR